MTVWSRTVAIERLKYFTLAIVKGLVYGARRKSVKAISSASTLGRYSCETPPVALLLSTSAWAYPNLHLVRQELAKFLSCASQVDQRLKVSPDSLP